MLATIDVVGRMTVIDQAQTLRHPMATLYRTLQFVLYKTNCDNRHELQPHELLSLIESILSAFGVLFHMAMLSPAAEREEVMRECLHMGM